MVFYGRWSRTDHQPIASARPRVIITSENGARYYQDTYKKDSLFGILFDENGNRKKDENGKKTDPRRIDTSKIRNMDALFYNISTFNDEIGGWDVSNVKYMKSMFRSANFFNQPIGGWNVSKVENMKHMFTIAQSFNQPIGNWNVSKVKNMSYMFYGLRMSTGDQMAMAFNQSIVNWDIRSVTDMTKMFNGTMYHTNQRFGRKIIDGVKIFQDLNNWKPSCKLSKKNVKDMFLKTFVWRAKRPLFWAEFYPRTNPDSILDKTTLADLGSQNCTSETQ